MNVMNGTIRFGIGYDVHRLIVNRKLILGGVEIPFIKGLEGHSDADVLCHAIADALLGAAAMGDIGSHFPDTDQRYKDISSIILLRHVAAMLREARYDIVNIDTTVVLQQPKIRSYVHRMRENISAALGVAIDQVSVKATTTEEMGFVGKGEGASAYSIAAIRHIGP